LLGLAYYYSTPAMQVATPFARWPWAPAPTDAIVVG
jgi:hypothetical protein